MRTLGVLVAVVLGGDGGSPAPPGRPAAYAEARRAFARAIGTGALEEAREALGRRRTAAPGRVDVQYDLACVEARAGQTERAFAALGPLAGAGLAVDPAEDPDLAALHSDVRWAPLVARFAAGRGPVRSGEATRAIPPELGLVEDLAADPRTGAVFVSSVRTGEVWRGHDGAWRAWAHPAAKGSGAFALGLDAQRRLLQVSVAAVPQSEGFRKADEGRSALVTYRLEDGTEVARREPPGDGPHLLGDMTVLADGTVLVSDALAGTVYRLGPGGSVLEALVPAHTFASPQTPALAADGRTWAGDRMAVVVQPVHGGAGDGAARRGTMREEATMARSSPLTEMRRICLALPETTETMTWGQPHFRVRGKIFAGFGDHRGTFTIGFKLEREHADAAVQDPRFTRAPYVGAHGWISMEVKGVRDWAEVRALVRESYRLIAPKQLWARAQGNGPAPEKATARRRAPPGAKPRRTLKPSSPASR